MKENRQVVNVDSTALIFNETKRSIYQEPENYYSIKENIKSLGIIEPLIVNKQTNVVISGNLRLQIALELGIEKVPVIFEDIEEPDMDITAISTNQTRIKSYSEILKELEFFELHYKVKKGQRTDLDPELKKLKEERDEILASIPKDTRNKLKNIDKMATELFGKNTDEYKRVFGDLDKQKLTLSATYNNLTDQIKRKNNKRVVPEFYEKITENVQIYNTSSSDMFQVSDKSVHAIITSPPYFNMRDYGTGKEQIGQEPDVDNFLNNLMEVFNECQRVLCDDGSIFVNINDCVINGKYQAVPQKFVIKMLDSGWILNDEILWIKSNPQYTQGKRSVRSHEPIFHFVKSSNFYYNDEWLQNLTDIENKISYGTNHTNPKAISAMDFRDGVLKTNAANTSELRKLCAEKGFHLTHSATFPLDVPTICALLTTKENDTILDCFAGTSTVGEFARRNNRKFIGYELNPEFVMASEVRIHETRNWNIIYPELSSADENDLTVAIKFFTGYTPKSDFKIPSSGSTFNEFNRVFNGLIDVINKFNQ